MRSETISTIDVLVALADIWKCEPVHPATVNTRLHEALPNVPNIEGYVKQLYDMHLIKNIGGKRIGVELTVDGMIVYNTVKAIDAKYHD